MAIALFRSSGYVRDPRQLPRYSCWDANWTVANSGANGTFTGAGGTPSDAFTGESSSLDRLPGSIHVNSAFTANTYKTIANITDGAGLIAGFMGPVNAGNPTGHTFTWRIVADGVEYIVATLAYGLWDGTNGSREYVGYIFPTAPADGTDANHNKHWSPLLAGTSSDGLTANLGTSGAMIPMAGDFRIPHVEFKRSLFVEAKSSLGVSNAGRYNVIINMIRTR